MATPVAVPELTPDVFVDAGFEPAVAFVPELVIEPVLETGPEPLAGLPGSEVVELLALPTAFPDVDVVPLTAPGSPAELPLPTDAEGKFELAEPEGIPLDGMPLDGMPLLGMPEVALPAVPPD